MLTCTSFMRMCSSDHHRNQAAGKGHVIDARLTEYSKVGRFWGGVKLSPRSEGDITLCLMSHLRRPALVDVKWAEGGQGH